jgi:Spy/CpxP family protein refolding chaperone
MTRKLTTLIAATTLGALGLSAAVLAAETPSPTQPDGVGMMTHMSGDQAKQMIANCDRMMAGMGVEGSDVQHPAAPPH